MYRSPTSSGGSSGFLMVLFLLWGAFYLTGCADVATSPAFDEFEEFPSCQPQSGASCGRGLGPRMLRGTYSMQCAGTYRFAGSTIGVQGWIF